MRTRLLLAGVVGVVLLVLGVQTKVICPNGPCATAPDTRGTVHRYYQMKPLGATLFEKVTELRLPIHYTSGTDTESLK